MDEEHQHERVIKRLVGMQKEKADAALKLQTQQEAAAEAAKKQDLQAELEI